MSTTVLARCIDHIPTQGKNRPFYARPVGYPNTGVICGLLDCDRPAVIYMEAADATAYKNGKRVFRYDSATSKVRADDSGVTPVY